jgi:predicted ATPase/class 3 adenylate cyclase/DNA-binding CsgD family transcriptional regulator
MTLDAGTVLLPALNWGYPVETDGDFLLPTGTVTMLLADVEASTRQWEADGDAMVAAMGDLATVVNDMIGRHDGVRPLEQGEGDSFVAAFARASDAVACALAIQQKLAGGRLRLRMGIHSAEAQRGPDKTYVGPPLNRTARLRDAGHGGQVLVSGTTAALVVDHLPAGAALVDLGTHRLKDLSRPERIHQLTHPELRADFPPLRTLATYRHNLPEQRSRFVGRTTETAEVLALLDAHRLVTLHGGGGCGKTRLALHVAAALLDGFPEGVHFVDLSPVSGSEGVTPAILEALELGRESDAALERVVAEGRRLLVLDNCEHVIGACAEVVDRLLDRGSELVVVATSREPLAVDGEVTYRVPSLPVPPEERSAGLDGLAPYAAAELFIDRATKVQPAFQPSETDAAAVADICRRLDGVPLAIELAAARVRSMTPTEIADGLDERFRLLTGGTRTALPRQQTLRASVDWSFDLLTDAERVLFRRLSVFVGGFTLDEAKAVATGDGIESHQVVDLVGLLVEKSLVVVDREGDSSRYRLLETIRAYAFAVLEGAGELDTVQRRHRDHFVRVDELDLVPPCPDRDNIAAAYRFSLAKGDLDAATDAMTRLVWRSIDSRKPAADELLARIGEVSPLSRTRLLIARTVIQGPPLELLAHAAADLAWCEEHGHVGPAAALRSGAVQERSMDSLLALSELYDSALAAGDRAAAVPIGLRMAGMAEWGVPDFDAAPYWRRLIDDVQGIGARLHIPWMMSRAQALALKGWARDSLELGDSIIDEPGLVGTWRAAFLVDRATCLLGLGQLDEAEELLDEAIAVASALDGSAGLGVAFHRLGVLRLAAGRPAEALERFTEAIRDVEASPNPQAAANLARFWADVAQVRASVLGDFPGADEALAAGSAIAAAPWQRSMVDLAAAVVARARGDLADAVERSHDALTGAAPFGFVRNVDLALELIAGVRAADGRFADASRLFGAAETLRVEAGDVHRFPPFDEWCEDDLAVLRSSLDPDELAAAWAEGAAMPWREAVAYAQRGRGARKRPSIGWGSLTPAELQVVELVAEGLSNQEVAARLFISPRTVGSHLTHVYTKLDLSNRTELVAALHRRR